MRVAVVGATGLIGTKGVTYLTQIGHQPSCLSLKSGTNVVTGEGLVEALAGADALIDVINPPMLGANAVTKFFSTGASNLVAAAAAAGIRHYVVLSIVGAHDLLESSYMVGKVAQERIVAESGLPHSIVRSTQFHESAATIASTYMSNQEIRVPDAFIQPVAASEVAALLGRTAVNEPVNGVINIGGPERISFAEMAELLVAFHRVNDTQIVIDHEARYLGATLQATSLVNDGDGVIGELSLLNWLWPLPDNSFRHTASDNRPNTPTPTDDPSWQDHVTTIQNVTSPYLPINAEVMTALVSWPPGFAGTPPHRHLGGPVFGYVIEGEMLFELEGDEPRVVKAGEAFWEPGCDVIHYSNANNRSDTPLRFVITTMCTPGAPMLTLVGERELRQRRDRRKSPADKN